jgi:hypothetical protein
MGVLERDKCSICRKLGNISRTYYHFPIACACCGPTHLELVRHCENCKPEMPKFTNVQIATAKLLDPVHEGLFKNVRDE